MSLSSTAASLKNNPKIQYKIKKKKFHRPAICNVLFQKVLSQSFPFITVPCNVAYYVIHRIFSNLILYCFFYTQIFTTNLASQASFQYLVRFIENAVGSHFFGTTLCIHALWLWLWLAVIRTCHPYFVPLVVRPGGGIHGPANVLGVGVRQRNWTDGRLLAVLCRILGFGKSKDLHCVLGHSQSTCVAEQLVCKHSP